MTLAVIADLRRGFGCPSSNDLEQAARFWSGELGLIGFRLCCLTLVAQAAGLNGLLFDARPFGQNGFVAPEVDVSRGQIADALVVTGVVLVVDEDSDGGLEVTLQEVVFQKDAVLEGLVPLSCSPTLGQFSG